MRLRGQKNTSVVNVLTGAHGGWLQVLPGEFFLILYLTLALLLLHSFTHCPAFPSWPSNARKYEPLSKVGAFLLTVTPSYSPGQSHDQVNVSATFPSIETSYSFQRPRCTYRKRCVHVLGTRQAHCAPSIKEGFVKFQRPQLREGSSEEADMGKEGLGGIL